VETNTVVIYELRDFKVVDEVTPPPLWVYRKSKATGNRSYQFGYDHIDVGLTKKMVRYLIPTLLLFLVAGSLNHFLKQVFTAMFCYFVMTWIFDLNQSI
jgi:hypothetical protein